MRTELEIARPMLSRKEVAGLLGCSTRTIIRRETAGELNPIRLSPRMIRYRESDVLALIEQADARAIIPKPDSFSDN